MAEYHSREESGLEPIPEEVPNQPLPTSSDTISNAERRWRTVKKFVKRYVIVKITYLCLRVLVKRFSWWV